MLRAANARQKTEQPSEAFDYITCAQGLMIIPDSMAALDGTYPSSIALSRILTM
jgi:hypothetical protein